MDTTTTINLIEFKKEHIKAIKENREMFKYKDKEVLTSYSKYVIQYLEQSKSRLV